jgi:hypothetical protein
MFANCSLSGMDIGFPDVCLTPAVPSPIPIPYPNLSTKLMAIPPTASMKCLISFMPAHNVCTTVPMTNGDNAGVATGVCSGTVMGPAMNTMCSAKVFMGGLPGTKWLNTALQNSTNVPGGMTLVPSQFKVMVMM